MSDTRRRLIERFVRENYRLLNAATFNRQTYSDIKKCFFDRILRLQIGIPKDKEICTLFIEYYIKKNKIKTIDILEDNVSRIPFYSNNPIDINQYKPLIDRIAQTYSIGGERDLIDQTSRDLIKKEKELEIRNQQQKISQLDRELEQKAETIKEHDDLIKKKQKEYKQLPSILDDDISQEPDEITNENAELKEWWKLLNLRTDPFPILQGLFLIKKDLYKEIVVETDPIKWIENHFEKIPITIFNKAFLLTGGLGTGKTTFFDYISPLAALKRIEPMRIALEEPLNQAQYISAFHKRLTKYICDLLQKYSSSNIQPNDYSIKGFDFSDTLINMLDLQKKGVSGFLIFIDDLHKHENTKLVFNFLSGLQITKDNFTREGINTIFIVSGLPIWKNTVKQNAAVSGFFDDATILELPDVTPQLASQVVLKRLQAFSVNPDKKINIKESFFQIIYNRISKDPKYANEGFRSFIKELIRHFQQGKFDILSVDNIHIDAGKIKEIRSILEENVNFKKAINQLIYGGKIQKKDVKELTLKLLCDVYLNQGIQEDNPLFKQHAFKYKKLEECGLIQKFNRNETLVWKIAPFLEDLNKKILKGYNLSIEDYIVPIYSEPTAKKILPISGTDEDIFIDTLKKDLLAWEHTNIFDTYVLNQLKESLNCFIEQIMPVKISKQAPHNLINALNKIKYCTWTLMKSILLFESPVIIDICGDSNIHGWKLRCRKPEDTEEFITLLLNHERSELKPADIARLTGYAVEAFMTFPR